MADALDTLSQQAKAMAESMGPGPRRKLAGELARAMRTIQSTRIRANLQPDGTPMTPRKPQPRLRGRKGALRRKMFGKLASNRWLKATYNATEASVDFAGRAGTLATTHQLGLRDKIKGRSIQYPARQLLGISKPDEQQIEQLMLDHIERAIV